MMEKLDIGRIRKLVDGYYDGKVTQSETESLLLLAEKLEGSAAMRENLGDLADEVMEIGIMESALSGFSAMSVTDGVNLPDGLESRISDNISALAGNSGTEIKRSKGLRRFFTYRRIGGAAAVVALLVMTSIFLLKHETVMTDPTLRFADNEMTGHSPEIVFQEPEIPVVESELVPDVVEKSGRSEKEGHQSTIYIHDKRNKKQIYTVPSVKRPVEHKYKREEVLALLEQSGFSVVPTLGDRNEVRLATKAIVEIPELMASAEIEKTVVTSCDEMSRMFASVRSDIYESITDIESVLADNKLK